MCERIYIFLKYKISHSPLENAQLWWDQVAQFTSFLRFFLSLLSKLEAVWGVLNLTLHSQHGNGDAEIKFIFALLVLGALPPPDNFWQLDWVLPRMLSKWESWRLSIQVLSLTLKCKRCRTSKWKFSLSSKRGVLAIEPRMMPVLCVYSPLRLIITHDFWCLFWTSNCAIYHSNIGVHQPRHTIMAKVLITMSLWIVGICLSLHQLSIEE